MSMPPNRSNTRSGLFFLKLTYTCSCLYLRIKPSKSRKKSYFFSFYLFSYCIKQHGENINTFNIMLKAKVYTVHINLEH